MADESSKPSGADDLARLTREWLEIWTTATTQLFTGAMPPNPADGLAALGQVAEKFAAKLTEPIREFVQSQKELTDYIADWARAQQDLADAAARWADLQRRLSGALTMWADPGKH